MYKNYPPEEFEKIRQACVERVRTLLQTRLAELSDTREAINDRYPFEDIYLQWEAVDFEEELIKELLNHLKQYYQPVNEYLSAFTRDAFNEKFHRLIHTDAFSALASGSTNTRDCEIIKRQFAELGMPDWCSNSDEIVCDMVRGIASRYMTLIDMEPVAQEAFVRICNEQGLAILRDPPQFMSMFDQYAPFSKALRDFIKAALEINAIDVLLECNDLADNEKRNAIQKVRDALKGKGVLSRYHRDFVMRCFVKALQWDWYLANGRETQFDY